MENGGGGSNSLLGLFVSLVTIGSLLCCLLLKDDNVRFYLPFSRFWELGIGVCIAYSEIFLKFKITNHSKFSSDMLSISGLILILISFFVPTSWYQAPPGLFSLCPVAGGAFLILANAKGYVNRTILSWRWMVFIGLISYSLYLWHWPFLVFLRLCIYNPSEWMVLLSLTLSVVSAIIVYCFVENPIRKLKTYNKICVFFLSVILLFLFASGKYIRSEDGFPQRAMAQTLSFKDDWLYPNGLVKTNGSKVRLLKDVGFPEVLFIGDSHVEQYYPRVERIAKEKGVNVGFITHGGCMTSIGKTIKGEICVNSVDELNGFINNPELKTLVIAQKWGDYSKEGSNLLRNGWDSYLLMINDFLKIDNSRNVYIIEDNPWDEGDDKEFDSAKYISRFSIKKKDLENNGIYVKLPTDKEWQYGNEYIRNKKIDSLLFIETASKICPGEICNLLNYKDDDHLRSTYVRDHATWIDQVFE